ncbi:MAG: protein disulfide oxidoreductase [Thermoplasmata archaeon]
MSLISEEDKKFLKKEFEKKMKDDVYVYVFTSNDNCRYCKETVDITNETASLHDAIHVEVLNVNSDKAKEMGVDKAPTTIITDNNEYGSRIRYIGIPAGYEFSSLIEDIISVSQRKVTFEEHVKEHLDEIDEPIEIKVFVTPTCPYCPRAVRTAHKFAQYNKYIHGKMIEAIEFPDWADQYGVSAVPHVVINDDVVFQGALPEHDFVENVMEVYSKMKNKK